MKKPQFVTIIFLSLLVSSICTSVAPAQTYLIQENSINSVSPTESLERIYGEDYSRDIWESISQSSFRNYVKLVTENGSRWIATPEHYSEQNGEARDWIAEELSRVSNGRIEVEIIGEYQSVVGRLPGYLPIEGPAFLVGGHLDSVIEASGANDDGTGIASMLEIARVMSQYEWPLDIYFGAWNAEEIGLRGSREVAREFAIRGINILVHYNVDMLLVPDPIDSTVLMGYLEGPYNLGQYWADLTVQMSNTYGNGIIEPLISTEFPGWERSDHMSFIYQGFESSLFAHESGGAYDEWYHTSGDVWDNEAYDYEIGAEAVKSIGAAIAFTQARAYQMPVHGERSFDITPGHERNFYMTITTETSINVSSRWWGGGATFSIYDPEGLLIEEIAFDDASPWESSIVLETPVSQRGVYQLHVFNHRGTTAGYDVSWVYDSDIDRNSITDSEEFWFGFDVNLFSTDQDSDTLTDAYEMIIGTDWESPDSDSDALPDNWELEYGLDPLDPSDALHDEDGDSLTNLEEFTYGSNPFLVDSDKDEIPDKWEIDNNLDPSVNDASEDPDNDQITNLEEYLAGSDPNVADVNPLSYLITPALQVGVIFMLVTASFFMYRRR